MNNNKRYSQAGTVILTVMLLVPAFFAFSEQGRVEDIVLHISKFSDGRPEKIISFSDAGKFTKLGIELPNGARVLSATMNVTSLPFTSGETDYPENITIDFGNDGPLEWAFQGKGFGQMGNQVIFSNGATSMNVSNPSNLGVNSSATVRLPKNATVSSTHLNITGGGGLGTPGKVLIIYSCSGYSGLVTDIQTYLLKFPEITGVDAFDGGAGTPTWEYVSGYSSILLFNLAYNSLRWSNPAGLGDLMANYVDAGGGVVCFLYMWMSGWTGQLTGRFGSGNYYCWSPTVSGMSCGSTLSWGSVQLPNHPVMKGVSSVNIPGQMWTGTVALAGTAQTVFTWGNSAQGCAVMTVNGSTNRVDIQMTPYTAGASAPQYSYGWAGDGDKLIRNALLWAGNQPINCSMDITRDGTVDWGNDSMRGKTEIIPDVAPQVNAYLATTSPNGTDAFGNAYVDVPLAILFNSSGTVKLSELAVAYDYTSVVDINPDHGNLTETLNALLPSKYDMKSTNITIAVSSSRSGKVKLSDLRIDYIPPVHPAIIDSRTPEDSIVLADENTTIEFGITAFDPYDYPMTTAWTVNGKPVLKNSFNLSWYADHSANGTYNVTVSVDNGLLKVATSWALIVKNVNRKPIIDTFSPDKKFVMEENSSAGFELAASDPDGDTLSYSWYADGKRVLSDETIYEYKTTYSSAGKHEIKVVVLDTLGGSTPLSWNVTVTDVNAAPIITDSSPAGDQVTMNENSSKKFTITDLSVDGDKQFVQWSVDENNTGTTGRSFNFSTGYDSAGTHVVLADVTDGKLSEKRTWTVLVEDVNRRPTAQVASPAPKADFLLGEETTLDGTTSTDPDGDALTMTWSDSGKVLGTGATLTVKLSKGRHLITLGVDDGRKNGNATAQVEMFVRYIDFSARLATDIETPHEGQKIAMTALLRNKGDGTVDELPVAFRVDGTEVATTTIESIEPDAEFPLEFQWTAVLGDHKLEVSVNNQNFTKLIAVARKPAVAKTEDSLMLLVVVSLVAIVAAAAATVVFASRRKRSADRAALVASVPEGREEPLSYEHAPEPGAVAAPAPQPPAAPDGAAAEAVLKKTEDVVLQAENAGLDVARARQTLKVAQNFHKMGRYQKVLDYCAAAEDSIG